VLVQEYFELKRQPLLQQAAISESSHRRMLRASHSAKARVALVDSPEYKSGKKASPGNDPVAAGHMLP
jgi:hypothetical protein